MSATRIPWATHSANWIAGCSKASPACANCFAERMTARLATMPDAPARYHDGVIEDGRWTGRLAYDPEAMDEAFFALRHAQRPRRVFCGSMSDCFHTDAPGESLVDLARKIRNQGCEWRHSLLLLTKRPAGLLAWQRAEFPAGLPPWVWVGVTAEDQARADERIPVLLQVQAGVRFVSVEPLLGSVVLHHTWFPSVLDPPIYSKRMAAARNGWVGNGLSWLIVGSEGGPHARPMDLAWVRSLRDQCQIVGVPYFYKAGPDSTGRRVECPELDGRRWTEIPEVM